MLSNWLFRFNQLLARWLYREHSRRRRKPMKADGNGNIIDGKQWNFEGSDD